MTTPPASAGLQTTIRVLIRRKSAVLHSGALAEICCSVSRSQLSTWKKGQEAHYSMSTKRRTSGWTARGSWELQSQRTCRGHHTSTLTNDATSQAIESAKKGIGNITNITNWPSWCKDQDRKSLQQVIKAAQSIIGTAQPAAVWLKIHKYPPLYHQTAKQLVSLQLWHHFTPPPRSIHKSFLCLWFH